MRRYVGAVRQAERADKADTLSECAAIVPVYSQIAISCQIATSSNVQKRFVIKTMFLSEWLASETVA